MTTVALLKKHGVLVGAQADQPVRVVVLDADAGPADIKPLKEEVHP